MKKSKKMIRICVAVTLVLALMLSACSATGQNKPATQREAQITEQVIWETDEIKVTAKRLGMHEYYDAVCLDIFIENRSDEDIIVETKFAAVNGIGVEASLYAMVSAGKSANESVELYQSGLDAAGISTIGDIELCLVRSVDYEDKDDSGDILIETDAKGTFEQKIPGADGKEVYNKDGVRIVYLGLGEGRFDGEALWFCAENTSVADKTIGSTDTSVNGIMTPVFAYYIIPEGKLGVFRADLDSHYLEENDIDKVSEVELRFDVYNSDDYSDSGESGVIHIDAAADEATVDGSGSSGKKDDEKDDGLVSMHYTPPKGFEKTEELEDLTQWMAADEAAQIEVRYGYLSEDEDIYASFTAGAMKKTIEDTFQGLGDDVEVTTTNYTKFEVDGYDAIRTDSEIGVSGNTMYMQIVVIHAGSQMITFHFGQLNTRELLQAFEQSIENIYFE